MEEINKIDGLDGLYKVKKVKIMYEFREVLGRLFIKNLDTCKVELKTKEEVIKNAMAIKNKKKQQK